MKLIRYILIILIVLGLLGEIQCGYKAIKCNWEPIGKAEIVYTVAFCTGFGSIIGWLNIVDK